MREGAKALVDTIKAFRLFLTPIQLLAVAQDRLATFCDRVRAKVPEDRQQEAAPSIALPILMDLRFIEDNNPLTKLYLNLLARAIDKERCNEAHPAFVKIIEQMSPDEAMVMYQFKEKDCWPFPPPLGRSALEYSFPHLTLANPSEMQVYLEHLEALNLIGLPTFYLEIERAGLQTSGRKGNGIEITEFGRLFIKACIPDDFDLARVTRYSTAANQ